MSTFKVKLGRYSVEYQFEGSKEDFVESFPKIHNDYRNIPPMKLSVIDDMLDYESEWIYNNHWMKTGDFRFNLLAKTEHYLLAQEVVVRKLNR
tara:strand:- start:1610 stop:1888 length:279 start_codon:yes stop_codon:yes gene_type:complete